MNKFKNALIRFATSLLPSKKLRKRVRRRLLDKVRDEWIARTVPKVRARYAENTNRCKEKISRGEKLKVCFLVCDLSMFSAESVFLKMREDPVFDCFIAIAPRVTRGDSFLRATQKKAIEVLSSRYENVIKLYDPDTRRAESLEGKADIVISSVVYTEQTLRQYTCEPMSKYALVACISYGYSGLLVNDSKRLVFLPEFSMFWKFFLPSPGTIEEWSAANPLLRENLRLGGYSKMDRLSGIRTRPRDRKKIMICPHHSLGRSGEGVSISNFLKYSDFFLELPARYPEIDFVFRPHPLLFPRLQTPEWWGEKKTREYKEKMSAFSNVEFQEGGDYFDSFVNSDAMIHDCGSFLAEYFYTGRPQCYLVESAEAVDREFTTFGKELISYTNPVLSESEIIKFIEDTVIAGRDLVADDRAKFASESVCLFYPRASDRVVGEIKESLEI